MSEDPSQISFDMDERVPEILNNYPDYQNSSIISQDNLDKSNDKVFLCKKCNKIPKLRFFINKNIEYICECQDSPKFLLIEEIFELIYDKSDFENIKFKCQIHNEEYFAFKLCDKCVDEYIIQMDKEKNFTYKKIVGDIEYINQKLNKLNDNINTISYQNIKKKPENNIEQKNKNNYYTYNEKSKEIEIFNNQNSDINDNTNIKDVLDNNYINLFNLITNDFKEYPNINHFEVIRNIEKFVTFIYGEFNDINLNYKFMEEDIKDNSTKLFGKKFVENNKDNCFLIIKDKLFDLCEFLSLSDIFQNMDIKFPLELDIKLIIRKRKKIKDLSYMFSGISTITSKSNFTNFNFETITDISCMFYNCSKLENLPDISNFDTSKVINMSSIFYKCSSIKHLPDISKWNTNSVNSMSYMFYKCSLLNQLPDISKWNTKNVWNMSYMFYKCSSIKEIPDISKWDIISVYNMNYMFSECSALSKFPNISKWNPENIQNFDNMFKNCKSILNLPYLSSFIKNIDSHNNDTSDEEIISIQNNDIVFIKYFKLIYDYFFHICNIKKLLFYYFFIIIIALLFVFIYIGPFLPLYNSFNLNNCFNNPIDYFNLESHINISNIEKILSFTNSSFTENYENKEYSIKKISNFTYINENLMIKSDIYFYKIYNIIIAIIFFFNIIILIFIFFNNKYKYFYLPNSAILLILLFSFNLISIIIEILDYNLNKKLSDSIKKYYNEIKNLFHIQTPEDNFDDKIFMDSSDIILSYIIISVLANALIIILCRKMLT